MFFRDADTLTKCAYLEGICEGTCKGNCKRTDGDRDGDVREAVMANSVHLFFCGSGFKGAGLFALTNDRSGANLPKTDCPAGWGFAKSTEMTEGEVGGIAVDAKVAAADLEKTGYHLIYAKGKEAAVGKPAM